MIIKVNVILTQKELLEVITNGLKDKMPYRPGLRSQEAIRIVSISPEDYEVTWGDLKLEPDPQVIIGQAVQKTITPVEEDDVPF